MVTSTTIKSATLPSGNVMPLNGFGSWKVAPEETAATVKAALDSGYTHLDCAAIYLNEAVVGEALSSYFSSTGRPRSEIFITSKAWNTCHSKEQVVEACKQSLKDLQLEYVDLYLVHHPFAWKHGGLPITEDNWVIRDQRGHIEWAKGVSLLETWRGMEEVKRLGLAKDIGVSNYSVMALMDILNYAEIPPAVNQCEAHVYNTRTELRQVCEQYGVHFTMYSILGSGKEGPLGDATVARIANGKGASPAQVLIAWGLAKNCSVLAKSSKAERIKENFASGAVVLTEEEITELDALDRKQLVCNMVEYWEFPSHA